MKPIFRACSIVTLGCVLPLAAQQTKTTETSEVQKHADGSVTKTDTTTTRTFNPEARSKVVTYFETYKGKPEWRAKFKGVPAEWRTSRIEPGVVVTETQRSHLVEAPADLVSVLPQPTAGVRYYVAGSNVVAVDESYRVVDSIQVPSIKIEADSDREEVDIEERRGGKKVETEIERDKDDNEMETKIQEERGGKKVETEIERDDEGNVEIETDEDD